MSKQISVDANKIHLEEITVFKTNIDASDGFLENDEEYEDFELTLEYQFGYNLEDEKTRVRLFITLDGTFSDNTDVWLKTEYGIEFHFYTENLNDYAKSKGENLNVNEDFAAVLLGMAYSTARGIVLERTRGTIFGAAILPVVNPYEVLKGIPG